MPCTCNKGGERLRDRAQLVADRAADGGRVLRQARGLRAARILREVKEGHLLRGSPRHVTRLVATCTHTVHWAQELVSTCSEEQDAHKPLGRG